MEITTGNLRELIYTLHLTYGYDFSDYSEASLKRRVLHYMQGRNYTSVASLEKLLVKNDHLFSEFIEEITVTVTEMFRDPTFYRILRDRVLKRLATYPFIKIWIAGCATGEEAYSMAILLAEENLYQRSIIYATDINQKSLEIAKEGVYPLDKMKNFTLNYQKSGGLKEFSVYYLADYGSALMDRSLRQNILFSPHNLVADKSFNEFQMILCRNVLIYFNKSLQNNVINLFYESLCPLGILGLGSKESLLFSEKRNYFDEIDRKEKIFIKIK